MAGEDESQLAREKNEADIKKTNLFLIVHFLLNCLIAILYKTVRFVSLLLRGTTS